jgi:hypothetical protein
LSGTGFAILWKRPLIVHGPTPMNSIFWMAFMKKKTKENVYTAFIGEAKAYFRLLAYAEKAEEEKMK